MLRQKEYNWNCVLQISSIESIHFAYDETFVLHMGSSKHNHHVVHVDKNCFILRMESINNLTSMTMISESEVVVGEKKRILLIDLKDKHKDREVRITDFESHYFEGSTLKSFFFEETKLFCLINYGRKQYDDYFVKAVYIPISSIYSGTTNNKIVQILKEKNHTRIVKVDNSSSISIISSDWKSDIISFSIISKDKIRCFSDKKKILHIVTNMWRKNQDQFYVQSRSRFNSQSEEKKMDHGIFTVDITREIVGFQTLVPETEEIVKIFFLDQFFFLIVKGSRYLLKMFDYEMKLYKVSKTRHNDEYSVCSYDGTMLMSFMRKKSQNTIELKKSKVISLKDTYMQMLLHKNEDFDDDFLLDSMNILGQE